MAERSIVEYPDPRLREDAASVTEFDSSLSRLADDLVDTLHAHAAIGLCAPQLGVGIQMLALDLSRNTSAAQVFVNPEITHARAWGLVEERCLSVPGIATHVWRATEIRVRALDPSGNSFERELSRMEAVVLQHEMDHFHGKLLVDRLWWWQRWRLNGRLKREAHPDGAMI